MDTIIHTVLKSTWPYIIAIVALYIIVHVIKAATSGQSNKSNTAKIKYKKKNIATQRELKFYKELRQVADRNRLSLFSKVRLADILEPDARERTSEYNSSFNKIKSKHIDFVLCDSVQLAPLLVIELDDSTHQRPDRKKRDAFVDEAMKSANIPIIHTYDANKLEEKIKSILGKK